MTKRVQPNTQPTYNIQIYILLRRRRTFRPSIRHHLTSQSRNIPTKYLIVSSKITQKQKKKTNLNIFFKTIILLSISTNQKKTDSILFDGKFKPNNIRYYIHIHTYNTYIQYIHTIPTYIYYKSMIVLKINVTDVNRYQY